MVSDTTVDLFDVMDELGSIVLFQSSPNETINILTSDNVGKSDYRAILIKRWHSLILLDHSNIKFLCQLNGICRDTYVYVHVPACV